MTSYTSSTGLLVEVPQFNPADFQVFQSKHFGEAAIALFTTDFPNPPNNPAETDHDAGVANLDCEKEQEEDDGLGYYPDGVKRTLTDEQIAIFRHSELEALRMAKERPQAEQKSKKAETMSDTHGSAVPVDPATAAVDDTIKLSEAKAQDERSNSVSEQGGMEPVDPKPKWTKKKKNKRKKTETPVRPPKPDLRKRTWDVVGNGMDSLDYDDCSASAGKSAPRPLQRQKISYDD